MKTKLMYSLLILLFFSCRPGAVGPEKNKKVVVHSFTGKGENNEITNWFFIKKVTERGVSGYYLESPAIVNDFKQVQFIYSTIRPHKFEGQSASEEKIQFLDPDDLPGNIIKDLDELESLYK